MVSPARASMRPPVVETRRLAREPRQLPGGDAPRAARVRAVRCQRGVEHPCFEVGCAPVHILRLPHPDSSSANIVTNCNTWRRASVKTFRISSRISRRCRFDAAC